MCAYICYTFVQGVATPEGLDEEQRAAWHRDAAFLAQLLDNSNVGRSQLEANGPSDLHDRDTRNGLHVS